MPYIKQGRRDELNGLVEQMGAALCFDGDLNFLLFAFCRRHVKPSYGNYKNFIGELNECIAEIRRRILAPYEDEKIIQNGDITRKEL